MRKLILMSLCVLFLSSISVWGAYAVSGQVKDESGNTVDGATVYINCYPGDGTSYSATTTSGQVAGVAGWYSGGWADKNCNGKKIVVKAVTAGKSGTLSWTAGGVADANKDVTVKASSFGPYAELHCEATPVAMNEQMIPVTCTVPLYVQMISGPVSINGGRATLLYDPTVMTCTGASSSPGSPFVVGTTSIGPGTITVEAHTLGGFYVSIQNGEHPTSFFDVFFEAIDVSTAKLATVTVTSQLYTPTGSKSGFPGVTQNLIGTPHTSSGHFLIDSQTEWEEARSSGHVHPLVELEWADYMDQWNLHKEEGDPYPTNIFKPASLYVYPGGPDLNPANDPDPEDAGLVMAWGESSDPDGSYSSAWVYDYLLDPDLSNSTITVTVTPRKNGSTGQINAVSFGIKDINGNIRSWWWSCGPAPATLPWNVATTIKIDASKIGIAAAVPVATGFANNPAFNIKNSQFFIVDENFQWIFGQMPVPPPGQPLFGVMWNYWHNLIVTQNLPSTGANGKNFIKWSQPPVEIEHGLINGWDEHSLYWQHPIMADDWKCSDKRPITDIHWWGSFIGWTQPTLPPVLPTAFHIGIWTDVPNGADPQHPFSHPGKLIWENTCTSWVWNFAGFDKDPQGRPERVNEACFQFNQLLSQDEWFYQEPMADGTPNVYWLSISAIYPQGQQMQFPFGWKTRPHFYNDDATRIGMVINPQGQNIWPPAIGSQWSNGMPIEYPAGTSWDLAFELTTNQQEPCYTLKGDLNHDCKVDIVDFGMFAADWLKTE